MLSADSQLCFAVLLAAFCHALAVVNHKTLVSSHNPDINTLVNHGFGFETRRWKCTVIIAPDRRYEMKTTIATIRLTRLVVKAVNLRADATEHWQIVLSYKVSIWSYFISLLSGFNEESNEIRTMFGCTVLSSSTEATTGVSADDLKELFAGYPWWSEQQSQPCIKITKLTGNNTDDLHDTFRLYHWQVVVFDVFVVLIVVIYGISFVHYAPAFLCFFSPTVVKENGVRQIILEGASPVSFRSLLGNYFFSEDDGTTWHKARTFTLLVVVLPGVYLPPAIALDKNYCWEEFNLLPDVTAFGAMHLFHPFYLVCYACYVLHAICICFLTVKSSDGETCTVCRRVQPIKIYNCRDQELLGQIIHHLGQQPLILLKCGRLFLRCLVNYFRICLSVVLPCKVSVSSFLGICLFPIFLLLIPLVALMLLTAVSLVALLGLYLTCPVSTILAVMLGRHNVHLDSCSTIFAVAFLCCCLCCAPLTNLGVLAVLSFAACAIMKSVFWAITLLFSEDSLPYLACFILVFYYVCSSYSSFTSKYQVLALTLYKHHKKSPVVTDQETERNTPIPGTLMRIPKELFDVACEQLMPIRVSVCFLVLRVASILAFVFLVFFLTMVYHVSGTPVTRALLTVLSGLLPKIIDIFRNEGQKNIATTAIDEKVPYIIEHYNNSRATEQNMETIVIM